VAFLAKANEASPSPSRAFDSKWPI
jgi:hypothetical protein